MDKTNITIGCENRPNLCKAAVLAYKELELGETVEVLIQETPEIIVRNQQPNKTLIIMTKVRQYTTQVINLRAINDNQNKNGVV